MSDKYGIDDKTRFLVLYLDAQLKLNDISRIINRAERTVRNWEKKVQHNIDIRIVREGRGRKKEITEEMEKMIIDQINEAPERVSLRKLAARVGKAASTIHSFLTQKGLKYKNYDETVIYDEKARMERVDFCSKMLTEGGKLTL